MARHRERRWAGRVFWVRHSAGKQEIEYLNPRAWVAVLFVAVSAALTLALVAGVLYAVAALADAVISDPPEVPRIVAR